jgi:hypothetical protein
MGGGGSGAALTAMSAAEAVPTTPRPISPLKIPISFVFMLFPEVN